MADVERFMRSAKGIAYLEGIKASLTGRTIVDVSFSNEVSFIATTLHLNDGTTFFVMEASLDVEVLREEFKEVIDEEYFKDYPERRKSESKR